MIKMVTETVAIKATEKGTVTVGNGEKRPQNRKTTGIRRVPGVINAGNTTEFVVFLHYSVVIPSLFLRYSFVNPSLIFRYS